MRARLLAAPVLVLLGLTACGPPGEELPGDVRLSGHALQEEGRYQTWQGLEERERLVVRSDAQWAEVWRRMHARTSPPPPRPYIDFRAHMLLVASTGSRPSSGYTLEVSPPVLRDGVQEVTVTERSPAASCWTLTVITRPTFVLRTARTDGAVRFVEAQEPVPCP